jgi:hypothetical protein
MAENSSTDKMAAFAFREHSAGMKSVISWPGAYLGPLFSKNGITLVNLEHTQGDMTAIVSAFTSGGFVIGADGRTLGKDKKVVCDCSQKIFNFKRQHIDVVYAWCGETHVVNESNDVLYDLNVIAQEALSSAFQIAGTDFFIFIQKCCEGIYDGIIKTPVVRRLTNSNFEPEAKARMLLNGYFDDVPFMTEVCVRETDRIRVRAEKVYNPILPPTRNLFNGCKEQNEKFANVLPATAIEALKFVSDYIQACIDNPDPGCFVVGGRRHIAHLTSGSFYWIEAPQNSN